MARTLPTPNTIDPGGVPSLRWGIVGSGWIAARFARALNVRSTQRIAAIASRNPATAAALARDAGIDKVHPTPETLVSDPSVDVVYVATPHITHCELALRAIAAGKHVLVEKPLATSAAEGREIVNAARAAGVFAMEAMWTRYLPQMDILRMLLVDGALGDVHLVTADFGFVVPFDPRSQMWNPALAGGALLDAGVYPVSFASFAIGPPTRISAVGAVTSTGVDAHAEMLLTTASGASALLATSMVSTSPTRAAIIGSAARIEVTSPFYAPGGLVMTWPSHTTEESISWRDAPLEETFDALSFQATALASYVGEGRTESPLHTLAETISVLETLDTVRAQVLAGPSDLF